MTQTTRYGRPPHRRLTSVWVQTRAGLLCGLGSTPTPAWADLAPPPVARDPLSGSSSLPAAPANRSPAPEITSGSIDKEVIRRVIRLHINEIRFCYEKGLAQNPSIEGRVSVSFRIGASGAVESSVVRESTLKSPDVEACIAGRVLRWQFPKPVGGSVGVTYPFVLQAQETKPSSAPKPEDSPVSKTRSAASPAPDGAWFSFGAYPGARLLCQEHVRAAGPRPMEIEWRLYATVEPMAGVVSHYEQQSRGKATPDRDRGGVDLTSRVDPRDKMSVFPVGKRAGYPRCDGVPKAGEQTLILVSRGIGG